MFIYRLKILSFRNIADQVYYPSRKINVLWGNNAQGKTNILEAIYLLGTLKSFRGATNLDLITQGENNSKIKSWMIADNVRHEIEIDFSSAGKKLLFDGKNVKNYKDFFSCLRPVIFSPEDVAVIKGAPGLRRALLDRAVFHSEPNYLQRVRDYEFCLKQRNKALQGKFPSNFIKPWTESLIKKGAVIRHQRFLFIREISVEFEEIYRVITGQKEEVNILYPSGLDNIVNNEESLRKDFFTVQQKEGHQGITLAGPHRDDVDFIVSGKSVRTFGSQGQQRSCMLAFKTAQIMKFKRETGETPILLLDDFDSELDKDRQNFYFDILLAHSGQVFITTTDCQPFLARKMENLSFFRMDNGRIIPDKEMRKE